MIILISGTVGIAKSIIATHLAERMNISNVLQTDIVESVMNRMYPELFTENLKTGEYPSKEALLAAYQKRCKLVRRGANTDIHKCLVEGKPLIIEGFTLDPSLYVQKVDPNENSQDNLEWNTQKLEELERMLKDPHSFTNKEEKTIKFYSGHLKEKLKIIPFQDPETTVSPF